MIRSNNRRRGRLAVLALAVLAVAIPLRSADVRKILAEVYPLPSTTGSEHLLAEAIADRIPRGLALEKEGLGGFAVRLGRGEPALMVLAPLDDFGFVVGGITPDGYLTLDRPVPPPHSFFDGFLLGNPVVISTRNGILQGVVAQPSMHLLDAERRRVLVDEFGLENAFVDIGTRSADEVRGRGIEFLDAVSFLPDLVELAGGRISGPSLATKALCAALVQSALELEAYRPRGAILLVFAAQTKASARGRGTRASLGAVRAKNLWRPARTIVLGRAESGGGAPGEALGKGPVLAHAGPNPPPLFGDISGAAGRMGLPIQTKSGTDSPLLRAFAEPDREVVALSVPVLFGDTPGETIDVQDLEALTRLLAAWLREGGRR
jgi:putative aminopeptidase FrvX